MNKLLLFLAVLVSPFTANAQLAVEYRFETAAGVGTPAPYFVNASILAGASNMYFGPGLTGPPGYTAGANAGGYGCNCQPTDKGIWASAWGVNNDPVTVNLNDYVGTTLTAPAASIVFIDSVKWYERRSGTGPQADQLRTSADGFTGVVWSGTNTSTIYVARKATSGFPSFSTSLDIRLYGYFPTGTAGTLRIDSLRIYAHIFSTLPVELLSFTGESVGEDVKLAWTTASELNNDHFEIWRSSDAVSWSEIGRVAGSGTTIVPHDYELWDQDPFIDINYYKLRQVDVDGTHEDSPAISVTVGGQEWFRHFGDQIISDKPTMLFDELGRILSGPSREHRIDRAGVFFLRREDDTRRKRLFLAPF